MSPHTSKCIRPNKSLALSPLPVKGAVVILPIKQDLHLSSELNSKEFIDSVNISLLNSTRSKVQVIAPLIDMTKKDIVKLGIDLNIPFKYIYSCYDDKIHQCGKCESCQRLIRALEMNNRQDIIEEIFN